MKTIHCSLLPYAVAALVGNPFIPAVLANSPPTLSPIANLTVSEDAGNQLVTLSGIGPGAPEEQQTLVITAVSSNPNLVPPPTIQYASPSDTGTLAFKPATNAFGTATITVIVNDGQPSENIVAQSFLVVVNAVNDPPRISDIRDQTMNENAALVIGFTIADVETPVSSLIVSGSSSEPLLIPEENIAFGGSGANRVVTVIPEPNQFGSATISVFVTDTTGATTRRDFTVTVTAQLAIKMEQANAKVSWSAANGVLQHRSAQGQWEDVLPEPTSPYTVPPSGAKFYRLRKR